MLGRTQLQVVVLSALLTWNGFVAKQSRALALVQAVFPVAFAQEGGCPNCGKGFDEMIQVVKEMRPLTSLPIMAQANAGLPELIDGKQVYTETAENIIPKVKQLLDLGVNIIGGCCGTGPSHIAAIHKLLRGK